MTRRLMTSAEKWFYGRFDPAFKFDGQIEFSTSKPLQPEIEAAYRVEMAKTTRNLIDGGE